MSENVRNPNNLQSVVIDIPDVSACSDNNSVIQPSPQIISRDVLLNPSPPRVPPQSNETETQYGDRVFGRNLGLAWIYSFLPILNRLQPRQNNMSSEIEQQNSTTYNNTQVTNRNPIGGVLPRTVTYTTQPIMQNNGVGNDEIPPPIADFNAPPPYDPPTKLPTYEEVQREKALQGEIPFTMAGTGQLQDGNHLQPPPSLGFLALDADVSSNVDTESKLLGTDYMFLMAFMIALFFNWIGFLLLMCFCHTVAARYGALSGFGLSLAKWTIIVKGSTDMPIQNGWLWWLVTAFGLLICIRSLFQYINIKRGWRLMSAATQERLLFFY